jgi:RNA polymerase sigma-70 factor, ECF subfamily
MLAANSLDQVSRSQSATAEFAALIKPMEKVLFARAMGLERTPADARDLVQDTLERGLRNFHQFQAGTNLKLWLFRIMYNLFVDRYRRRSHDMNAECIDELELAAPMPDPPEVWEGYDRKFVTDTLDRLEPPFRKVLELHFLDARSYRDIGAELGIPTGTVGTRILRARKKLRTLLGDQVEQAA